MIQILTQSSQNYSHRHGAGPEVSGVCLVSFSRSHPMYHGIWWAIDPMFFLHGSTFILFPVSVILWLVFMFCNLFLIIFCFFPPSFSLSFSNIFFFYLGNNGGLGAKALGRSWNARGSATPLAARDALATYSSASLEPDRRLLAVWRTADGFGFYKRPVCCSLKLFL